jgi:hypothetical protein
LTSCPVHPIAPTSDAGSAERDEPPGSKIYDEGGFSDPKDSVGNWRAIAVFGALLLLEDAMFRNTIVITLTTTGPAPFFPWIALGVIVLICAGGLVVALMGFGAEAEACFGAAAFGFGVYTIIDNTSVLPAASVPAFSTDVTLFWIMMGVGVLLIAVGGVKMMHTERRLSRPVTAG